MILNLSGSSNNSLNFKVVGGTTRPLNPKENTIWVNTSVEITGYAFSEASPTSKTDGMVWFSVNFNTNVSFNAIKKDIVMVYPISAKQYSSGGWSGNWTERSAEIYQNGKWIALGGAEVAVLWIFKSGTGLGSGFTGFTNATCSKNEVSDVDDLYVRSSETTYIVTKEPVDITNYKTLHISGLNCHFNANGNSHTTWLGLGVVSSSGSILAETGIKETTSSGGYLAENSSVNLDVSRVTGKVYVGLLLTTSADYPITIDNFSFGYLWLD